MCDIELDKKGISDMLFPICSLLICLVSCNILQLVVILNCSYQWHPQRRFSC